jgi:signal transduction histidine kinase
MQAFGQLSNSSEDKYKGMIFTYFVGAVWIIAAINAVQNLYLSLTIEGEVRQDYASYNPINFIFLLVLGVIWVGHRWYPQLMRHAFIVMMVLSTIFAFELTDVNELFVALTLPIIMAAFLVRPIYSFIYYFFIIITYALRVYLEGFSIFDEDIVPFVSLVALIAFAFVAWLIAGSLERALNESRALNRELDQRVQERTRELAEALARESATAMRNKTILESIADGVLVFDANKRVMIANPAANQLAEKSLQNLTLAEILATIEEKAGEMIRHWLWGEKPADQNNVKFEWQGRTISANIAPVVLPTSAEERTDAGHVMVLRDFTKEAELERAKSVFLGMVSHELRTPMSAIKGYVEVLLQMEKDHLSEAGYEYLQTIGVSIKQLLTLANELIDLSRMESGEIEIYREWSDLTGIIKQAVKIVQQEFTARNLSLEVKLESELPKLYLDRNRTLQILLNLLSNAYKYTRQGGATVIVSQTDDWVYVAVKDTGIGIRAADQASLFNRFFRANDKVVQKVGGTGLGLSISKGLTELHGGTLTFASQYGVGTTFTIALPKNGAEPSDNYNLQNNQMILQSQN